MPRQLNMGKKKTSKSNDRVNHRSELAKRLLSLLDQSNGKAFSLKQIIKKLGLKKKEDIKITGQVVDELVESERLLESKAGSYKSNKPEEEVTGVVDHVSSRFAYVKVNPEEPDIYIKGRDLGSAVDGDTVQVVVFPTRHGEHPEGKITK